MKAEKGQAISDESDEKGRTVTIEKQAFGTSFEELCTAVLICFKPGGILPI